MKEINGYFPNFQGGATALLAPGAHEMTPQARLHRGPDHGSLHPTPAVVPRGCSGRNRLPRRPALRLACRRWW